MALFIVKCLIAFCCLMNEISSEYIDMSRISYSFNGKNWFTRIFGDVDYIQFHTPYSDCYISCHYGQCINQKNVYFECIYGEGISLRLLIRNGYQSASIPYKVTCENYKHDGFVYNLRGTPYASAVHLTWSTNGDADQVFIVYMDGSSCNDIHLNQMHSYYMTNLRERTFYQICVATLYRSRSGSYKCIMVQTDFAQYAPVGYIQSTVSSDHANISWYQPSDMPTSPNGYIISYTGPTKEGCRAIIINMNIYSIDHFNPCPNKTEIQQLYNYERSKTLTIRNLTPHTAYSISIRGVLLPKPSAYQFMTVTTLQGESGPVQSLRASLHNDSLQIYYDTPIHPNGIIVRYKVKVVRENTQLCNETMDTLIDLSNITMNHLDIPMTSEGKCAIFRIRVIPINGWIRNHGEGQQSEITFQGFQTQIEDVHARFLSSDTAQISWTTDGCDDVAYMIEVTDKHNPSDCTTTMSSLDNCSLLNDMMTQESACTNIGAMTLLNDGASVVVNITNPFSYMREYRIKIWKIINNATLVAQFSITSHSDNTEIYDEYIRISKRQLMIFWSLNTASDGSITEYIIRFRELSSECLGSTHLICMDYSGYNSYSNLSDSDQIKKDYLLNCSNKQSLVLRKENDTYYSNLTTNATPKNLSVDIYAVTDGGIYNIYTKNRNVKPIFSPNITEVFYHIDTSKRHFMFFWRYDIKSGVFVFNFIIRVSTQSHKCVQSINYVCDSCYGINTNTSLSRQQISDWDKLLICRQQSTEVFTRHTAFFSGSISSPESLDNVVLSIYGLSSLGIHILY